jgi:hypothetical protein
MSCGKVFSNVVYALAGLDSSRGFSTKDFPPPFPHSVTRTTPQATHKAPAHEVNASSRPPTALVRYTRNLSGIIGVVTTATEPVEIAPTGLGDDIDKYFNAHGYDAGSRLHVMHAWRNNHGVQDFIVYLCGKGVVKSEAEWLWNFLVERS